MIHPDTCLKFIDDTVGVGVVATKDIPKGTITWALDPLDRHISPDEAEAMGPLYQNILDTYAYRDRKGMLVLCWDYARFVNHSFSANCFTTAYNFEIAIRDIAAGEQLTDDYGYLNIDEPFTPVLEPGSTRTVVYPDDLPRYSQQWDKLLISAIKLLPQQEQPLKSILQQGVWEKMNEIADGRAKMRSVLTCYFDRNSQPSKQNL